MLGEVNTLGDGLSQENVKVSYLFCCLSGDAVPLGSQILCGNLAKPMASAVVLGYLSLILGEKLVT